MKRKILFFSLFFVVNYTGYSQIVDVGYKANCIESYSDIIYESLLSIIDSTVLNDLIKQNVKFRVRIELSTKTGFPNEILIIDNSNVLSKEKEIEYKTHLFKTRFYLCHNEHDLYDKPAKDVFTGENIIVFTSFFSTWWYMKFVLQKYESK